MKILKSLKRVVCGFLDAIKGIIKGDISMSEAYHFAEGSRAQRKKDEKEEAKRLQKEDREANKKMQKDISDIAEILRHRKIEEDEEETMWPNSNLMNFGIDFNLLRCYNFYVK